MSTAMAVTEAGTALDIEQLQVVPTSTDQAAAASAVVAHHARDKDDLGLLLEALGLPTDDDTLTTLLPLLPENGDTPTMTNTSPDLSAHEAVAISMHNNGDSEEVIRKATGLSETELSDLIAEQVLGLPRTPADSPAAPASTEIEQLLAWAETHPAAGIRSKAVRVRADLAELTERRSTDDAQREAEERVAKLKAELEKAQEDLRTVKTGGGRTASTAPAPTPIGATRRREQLAAIRTWARANGHRVADQGIIPKKIVAAYDAAHQSPVAKAS